MIREWVEAHAERRMLMLQIRLMTRSKTTATIAYVLARLAWLRYGGSVNGYLRAFKELVAAGVVT